MKGSEEQEVGCPPTLRDVPLGKCDHCESLRKEAARIGRFIDVVAQRPTICL